MGPFCSKTGDIKPSAPINLDRQRQIITRLQSLRIASTFPLLALPAELRLMIYGFCISFSAIENFFDNFWQSLKTSTRPSRVTPPVIYKKDSQALFRVCKQVYHEAREVLKKQSISFHHGLLDTTGLQNFMNIDILKNITSITIDAKGHAILPKTKSLVGPSWRGHLDLIVDVSNALASGHRLKNFTLDFTDVSIHGHVHDCWSKSIRCDYRDQLTEALEHLRKIRSVGTVNLIGIPTALIPDLKARMESSPPTLLSMPGEIRNLIYFYAADLSDISAQLTRTMRAWVAEDPEQKKEPRYPYRTTPTILLLNKQIYSEAKSVIYAKPLVLNMPEDKKLGRTTETLNALRLISPRTLAKVKHMQVYVESWEWVYALDKVLPHLARVHSLRTFKFVFRDALKATFLKQDKAYPDHTLHLSLSGLAKMRGIGLVEFEGELPAVYTAPLKTIMESPKVHGEVLPALKGVKAVWDVENKEVMELLVVDIED